MCYNIERKIHIGRIFVAKKGKDYFNLGRFTSIILAIIPVTSWLLGAVTRFKEGKIIAGLLRIFLGWNIIYVLDIFLIIFKGKILRLLNI